MNLSFENKIVLITGGLGNLGSEIVKNFISSNAKRIIVIDKDPKLLEKLKKYNDEQILFLELDLENFAIDKRLLLKPIKENGGIDILINNAAFVGQSKLKNWNTDYINQSLETWDMAHHLNLTVPNELIKFLLPYFRNDISTSSILNISSIYGTLAPRWNLYKDLPMNNPAAYNTSKAGLIQLTKYLASYLGQQNIRVNALSPGGIAGGQPKTFVNRYKKLTPLNRMATFEEIGRIACIINHDTFSYLNGHNLVIDGGFSI